MGKPEANFQKNFIKLLKEMGFKCIRVKASGSNNKSYPDYAVFYKKFWAWLEFKRAKDAEIQPGQLEKVQWAKENSFGAFVYPENGEIVLHKLINIKYRQDAEE